MKTTRWTAMACVLAGAQLAAAQEKEGVALTVYNGNYAVVREVRRLDVPADGQVKFADVPKGIDATTVHFKSLTDPAAKLLEQNYQYDLVSADKLLEKYIDRPIVVVCDNQRYAGTLLSFDAGQIVLKAEGGGLAMVQRADNVRDIQFQVLPEGLLTRPTLLWLVATDKPGAHLVEVTYQTTGTNWHAEYVLVLGGDDTEADLSGWVSVENRSGKTYRDAKMKFIAGDVRRVAPRPQPMELARAMKAEAAGAAVMEEKAFFEYHMYTLQRPSTVADNEIKQLEMFAPVRGMKVDKKFLYQPNRMRWGGGVYNQQGFGLTVDKKVQVFIEFVNSEANKLGLPLPAGKVRVYKQDPDDKALEFVGEEQIDHTPRNETLSLQIGNAFDLVGERIQKHWETRGNNFIRETIEVKLRNQKKAGDVVIRVKEPMYRAKNWKITEKSHDFQQLDSHTVVFDVPVPAGQEVVVTFTVEYWW